MFAVVKSRGKGSVWNFFFRVVLPKKGNKQSKETSPATACLLQRPYLGNADGWSHLQPKNWPELFPALWWITFSAPGSPQTWLQPEKSHGTLVPEQHHSSLSRDTAQPGKAKGFSLWYLHLNRPHQPAPRTGWTCLGSQDGEKGAGVEAEPF